MNRISLLFVVLAMAAPWTGAQTTDPATKDLIEKLLARIDGLEKRVMELEKGNPPATAAAAAPVTPPKGGPTTQAMHASHDQAPTPPAAGPDTSPVYPFLKLTGFSDLNFSATDLHSAATGFGAQRRKRARSAFEVAPVGGRAPEYEPGAGDLDVPSFLRGQ